MTLNELRGALVFFSEEKADCVSCHTGPSLSDGRFHAMGLSDLRGVRVRGQSLLQDVTLGRMSFTGNEHKDRVFFGHGSSMTSLRKIVTYMSKGEPQKSDIPRSALDREFTARGLTTRELEDLLLFVKGALYDPGLQRYQPNELPSENCSSNGDTISAKVKECFNPRCTRDVYNCSDFKRCTDVEHVFEACSGDPHRLDQNADGIPCNALCNEM
jgi:cytochrome c peroxidase